MGKGQEVKADGSVMKYDIFISYRRDGGDTLAQLIYDRLTSRGYRVFLDIESLRSGKFNEKLLNVIEECNDVVVILPPNALERCKNPGDWLYCEVSHAIKCQKNLVPIMMNGFSWPEDMPEGIRELANYNGITDSKNYFDAAIDKLTMLVVSKPMLFKGVYRKNTAKNIVPKIVPVMQRNEKDNGKKKKVFVVCITICLFLIMAGIYFISKNEKKSLETKEEVQVQEAENANMELLDTQDSITVVLRATEDMGISDYQNAVEVISKRMEILANGYSYECIDEGGQIALRFPVGILGKEDFVDNIKAYISRPVKLNLLPADVSHGFTPIYPEDIASVTLKRGEITYIDPEEEYGLEPGKEYSYFHICFTPEFNQKIEELYDDGEEFSLAQDFDEFRMESRFYSLVKSETEDGYYFADELQSDNINEVIQYNYTHDSFEKAMTVEVRYPVEWEETADLADKGVNQCNENELTGELMVISYTPAFPDDLTDGEALDVMLNMKKRLDALNTPYAFGKTKTGVHEFVVKMGIHNIGSEILSMVGKRGGDVWLSNPYCYVTSFNADVEKIQKEDGTYALAVTGLKEWDIESLKKDLENISEGKNQNLYISYDSFSPFVLAKANVEVISEHLNEGQILFDNIIGWGANSITEENSFLLDFVVAYQTCPLPESYEISSYYFENVEQKDAGTEILGVSNQYLYDTVMKYVKAILSSYPEAEVSMNSNKELEIAIALELNEQMPQQMIDIMKDLYYNCGLHEGEVKYNIVVYDKKDASMQIKVAMEKYIYQAQQFYLYYSGEKTCPYAEEFADLITKDEFFQTEMVPDFEDGLFYLGF